jgi:hypothetical protein
MSIALFGVAAAACGPVSSRIYVEADPADAGRDSSRGQIGPGPGGTNEGNGGRDSASPPSPTDARPDAAPPRDTAPDRTVDTARPPDLGPEAPRADAAAPDSAPDAAGPPPGVNLGMGLISRWKLDEASGNGVADSVGGRNNGTLSGAVRVEGGFPGARHPNPGSLRFDGDNDFVELGTSGLPGNNQRQSVVFWVNIAAMPTNNRACMSLTDGDEGGSRLKIGFKDNRVAAWKGGDDDLVSAPPLGPGWHHYVYTFDGNTHRLYLDGVQRGTGTAAPDTGAVSNARIAAIFNNAENFQGLIDDVRIYNRPITAAEAMALRNGFE